MALGANGEEERSLRDDLAATMKEIEEREASETTAAPKGDEPPAPQAEAKVESPEANTDRGDGRDVHGKFVAKPKEGEADGTTAASQADTTDTARSATRDQTATTTTDVSTEADTPPKSWRADEASAWKDLPATAKSAILRREAEAARLAGANDGERMFGREMADLFRPHLQEIQAAGASPQQAVKILLDNHNALRSSDPNVKLGKARELLASYGIDPTQVAQPDPNAPDPTVAPLLQRINQLEQRLANPQGQQFAPLPPSAEEGNIIAEIEAFRADPAHPHFDAVHPAMGRLLETGAAPDLESAYQAAVAMDPALRSTAAPQAPQRTQEERTAAARRASASVTSSPGPTGQQVPLTMRDELAEGLRNAGFRV